jgi:p-aminobenzoyl-glutamate transporter AbgT
VKLGRFKTEKRKGTAGGVLKLIVFLAVYCLFIVVLLPTRWWIGEKFIKPVIGNYQPTSEEADILNTMDNALYVLVWGGFFAILLTIAIEIFRETTEGKVYASR